VNLTPERNRTIEAGFETNLLSKKIRVNSVAFFREQNNFIGFFTNPVTFAGNYVNIDGETKAKGVETEVRFLATDKITFNANYTFTEVDEALKRLIPKNKINAAIDYAVTSRFNFNINWQYTDQRNDAFFDGNTFKSVQTVLGAYRLINSTIQYKLIPNRLNVFANVTNATNEEFVENVGFSTRGRNIRFGLDFKF
jgi:vitamin B12 transporter